MRHARIVRSKVMTRRYPKALRKNSLEESGTNLAAFHARGMASQSAIAAPKVCTPVMNTEFRK